MTPANRKGRQLSPRGTGAVQTGEEQLRFLRGRGVLASHPSPIFASPKSAIHSAPSVSSFLTRPS